MPALLESTMDRSGLLGNGIALKKAQRAPPPASHTDISMNRRQRMADTGHRGKDWHRRSLERTEYLEKQPL